MLLSIWACQKPEANPLSLVSQPLNGLFIMVKLKNIQLLQSARYVSLHRGTFKSSGSLEDCMVFFIPTKEKEFLIDRLLGSENCTNSCRRAKIPTYQYNTFQDDNIFP
jgi:hypothetical protein